MSEEITTINVDSEPIPLENDTTNRPAQAPVIVRFKKLESIDIEIDPDALTWGDFLMISSAGSSGLDEAETMAKVNGVLTKLTGQDVTLMPARVVNAILGQLQKIADPEKN